MAAKLLAGLRVVSFEARRADELATMLARHGAEVVRAPALREERLAASPEALELARRLEAGEVDLVVPLTGVGTRALAAVLAVAGPRPRARSRPRPRPSRAAPRMSRCSRTPRRWSISSAPPPTPRPSAVASRARWSRRSDPSAAKRSRRTASRRTWRRHRPRWGRWWRSWRPARATWSPPSGGLGCREVTVARRRHVCDARAPPCWEALRLAHPLRTASALRRRSAIHPMVEGAHAS